MGILYEHMVSHKWYGIPNGEQFHIFLAVLITFNYSNFRKYINSKETSDLIIK